MTASGLDTFDRTLQQTHVWLNDIGKRLGCNRQHSWHALRAVLHTLRDRLTAGEAAKLASELPLLVRGLYFEGWSPDSAPLKLRDAAAFLAEVGRRYELDGGPGDIEQMTHAVLDVLQDHVSAGEIRKVLHQLPEGLQELWA